MPLNVKINPATDCTGSTIMVLITNPIENNIKIIGEKGYAITLAVIFPARFIFINPHPNKIKNKNDTIITVSVRISNVPETTIMHVQMPEYISAIYGVL